MRLKALLFDVDGTLSDTEQQGHLPAYNAAFEEIGLSWHWSQELYRKELLLLPGGRERIRHYLIKHKPRVDAFADELERDQLHWVNLVHEAKSRWFRRRLEEGKVTLRPGVARLIEQAKHEGLRLAVVTNASERSLKPFLHYALGARLAEQFDFIVSGEQVARKKPAPDLYLRAVERLELQAGECLAIEDSGMGLCAAAAAGVPTLITANDDTLEHDFDAAQAVVSHLGEPDAPWQVIQGGNQLNGHTHATLDALDRLLAA